MSAERLKGKVSSLADLFKNVMRCEYCVYSCRVTEREPIRPITDDWAVFLVQFCRDGRPCFSPTKPSEQPEIGDRCQKGPWELPEAEVA